MSLNYRWFPLLGLALGFTACPPPNSADLHLGERFPLSASVEEFVQDLNALHHPGNPPLGTQTQRANHFEKEGQIRLYFRHGRDSFALDTVLVVDEQGDSIAGDPYDLEQVTLTTLDTQYLNPDGFFRWQLPTGDSLCPALMALLQVHPKAPTPELEFHSLGRRTCETWPSSFTADPTAKARELFKNQFQSLLKQ